MNMRKSDRTWRTGLPQMRLCDLRGPSHLSWGRAPRWTWTAGWGSPHRKTRRVSSAAADERTSCPGGAPRPVRPEGAASRLHWRRGGSAGEGSAPSSWTPIRNFINRTKSLQLLPAADLLLQEHTSLQTRFGMRCFGSSLPPPHPSGCAFNPMNRQRCRKQGCTRS